MTKVLLSSYYMILAYLTFINGSRILGASPNRAEFVMFAKPFASLLVFDLAFLVLFILALAFSLASIINSQIKLRIFASLLFLVLFSIKFSYGKINHSEHIWMISSILMCFISEKNNLKSFKNFLIVRLMQATLLSFYFISGLWKVRELGLSNWGDAALDHVAYVIAEGNGPGGSLQQLLTLDYPWIVTLGFSMVIFFQLSSAYPIFARAHFKVWGICAVFFHMTTGVALGIWFSPTALAALLMLVFFEKLIDWEHTD